MKLRASYRVNGNLPTGYYGYHGTYTTGAFYNGKPDPWEDAIANPDLTWEKAKKMNVGVDINLFNNCLTASFDIFKEKRNNILANRS
ncbi:TonB-dependent receptor, partial [Klebsiella pneumoniae]|nr:TonB-dependent receptor [Klebsiella pneumoniae]